MGRHRRHHPRHRNNYAKGFFSGIFGAFGGVIKMFCTIVGWLMVIAVVLGFWALLILFTLSEINPVVGFIVWIAIAAILISIGRS